MKLALLSAGAIFCASSLLAQQSSGQDCTYRRDPDAFLNRALRTQRELFDGSKRLALTRSVAGTLVEAGSIPYRSFVDAEIFGALATAGRKSAPLATDQEFVRRLYLDLTGRPPSPAEVRGFLADTSANKRDVLIGKLLYSPEFTDKWMLWIGDLFNNTATQTIVNRQVTGRNAYHNWLKASVANGVPLKDMVYEAIIGNGNNFVVPQVNFELSGRATGGPNQDVYDLMLYQTASRFLGLGHYDCLLCHDGRRHLDSLSLWGKDSTRLEAEKMAAFFSRVAWRQPYNTAGADTTAFFYNSWDLSDNAAGNYSLSSNFGNRPNREPVGTVKTVEPLYRDGTSASGVNWRASLAEKVVHDPLLAINLANRIWKQLFNYGLIEPVDAIDPARLDPNNPPPAPWTLQATHPKLLQMLGAEMITRNFNLREFIHLLVESSAYQLSSRYDGDWNSTDIPLFARHYARRLEGEEVGDAIVKATGVAQLYTVGGWVDPVQWAIQLPEPVEPRSNGTVAGFLNRFLRGNRDTTQRDQSGSILQQLGLMNDSFVNNRTKVSASPTLKAIAGMPDSAAADELFLTFLSRLPSEAEKSQILAILAKANTTALRNTAIEDLGWTMINMAEFIYSY